MGRFSWDVWLGDYTDPYREKEKRGISQVRICSPAGIEDGG